MAGCGRMDGNTLKDEGISSLLSTIVLLKVPEPNWKSITIFKIIKSPVGSVTFALKAKLRTELIYEEGTIRTFP